MRAEHKDRLACGMLIERLPEGLRLTWSELHPHVFDTAPNVESAVACLRSWSAFFRVAAQSSKRVGSTHETYLRDRAAFLDIVADVLREHAERMEVQS